MAVGQSDDVDAAAAIAEAVEQCRAQLDGREPVAGILFAAPDNFDESLWRIVGEAFPRIALIGSTSAAEMSSVVGYREDSVSLAVFAADGIDAVTGFGEGVDSDPLAAAREAVGQALAQTSLEPKVCIVLTDPLAGQNVAEALRRELPSDVLIVGGAAGRNELGGTSPTYQFRNERVSSTGVAILVLAGAVSFSTAVGTGWRVLGPRGTVTRASYGAIHEIDGRPAAEWVGQYLDLSGGGTFGNPLAVQDAGSQSWYLRVVLGGDASGSLAIPGAVPEGATVQLTTTSPDQMLEATADAVKRALGAFPGEGEPTAALLFSCAVRKYLLGTRTAQEVEAARINLPESLPIAGMYCIGEIAPTDEQHAGSHFLNETFVTLLLGG